MTDFEEFQQFRRILCVCPCCGEIVRVSDLHLKTKGPDVRTWLDDFEKRSLELSQKESEFDEIEGELRDKAREKGRKEAEKAFYKAICPSLKQLKLDPYDVKPILHPVDFVVFNGMNKEETINDIVFLSKTLDCTSLNSLRCDIKTAVTKNNYSWQVARIDTEGNITFE